MENLAIIPARSGSKGLPDKNIRPLEGKPLLAWSVDAARQSGLFSEIYVSTDSEQYARIARAYGAAAPFLRGAEASGDAASSWAAVREALDRYEALGRRFDTVTLLQPTSPLRTADDIRGAFAVLEEKRAGAVVSLCEAEHSPLWCNTLPPDGCMRDFQRSGGGRPRQELPRYYRFNGAIYLLRTDVFQETGTLVCDERCFAFLMPPARSVDIDGELDFWIAEAVLRHTRREPQDAAL